MTWTPIVPGDMRFNRRDAVRIISAGDVVMPAAVYATLGVPQRAAFDADASGTRLAIRAAGPGDAYTISVRPYGHGQSVAVNAKVALRECGRLPQRTARVVAHHIEGARLVLDVSPLPLLHVKEDEA